MIITKKDKVLFAENYKSYNNATEAFNFLNGYPVVVDNNVEDDFEVVYKTAEEMLQEETTQS